MHDTGNNTILYQCVDCKSIYESDTCASRLTIVGKEDARELYCRGCNGNVTEVTDSEE